MKLDPDRLILVILGFSIGFWLGLGVAAWVEGKRRENKNQG